MTQAGLGLVPMWSRSPTTVDRAAHVLFVCFARGPLRDDVPMRVDRFGVSSAASLHSVVVREHLREQSPEWFDGWRSGSLRVIATHGLGELTALDEADRCLTLEVRLPDPTDLAYLQSMWALVRWCFARGATVGLDAHAMRYFGPDAMWAPDATFEVRREVSLIFETDPNGPDGRHVLHTRGLRKFARPDLVFLCQPNEVGFVSKVLWHLTEAMALGFCPALPAQGVDLSPTETWYVVDDEQGVYAQRLGLNNDARLVVTQAPGRTQSKSSAAASE